MFHFQSPKILSKIPHKLKLPAVIFAVILVLLFTSMPRALTEQPVTLSMLMTAPDAQPWKTGIIKDFEAKNPGIRINIVEGPNSTNLLEDLYTSAFILGDSPYDLVNMDVVWTPKFAAAGWLLDLTDKISSDELTSFSEKDVEGRRYQEKLYAIPMRSDVGMLYYRKDLLEKAGLAAPQTFADLMEISQTLQKGNKAKWGYIWQGKQYEGLVAMFAEVLQGYGGFWVNPENLEVGLDRPATIEAIKFLKQTIADKVSPSGVTTYQEEETRRLFQSGQAVFLRNWPYVWPLANTDDSPLKGKIAIKPMLATPNNTGGACLGGWALGISKSSKHPEEAWKAIKYFTSEAAQRKFILEAGFVPSRRSLFTDPEIVKKYPHYPTLLKVVEQAVLRPPIPQYAQASDILQRYLSAALTNRMSPEAAMSAAANETRQLLGEKVNQRISIADGKVNLQEISEDKSENLLQTSILETAKLETAKLETAKLEAVKLETAKLENTELSSRKEFTPELLEKKSVVSDEKQDRDIQSVNILHEEISLIQSEEKSLITQQDEPLLLSSK